MFQHHAVDQNEDHRVGITFTDVLFALVAERLLEEIADASQMPAAAIAHFCLAVTLTMLSWIGYHNSLARPRGRIGFFNWEFLSFLTDVLLVGSYWYVATATEFIESGKAQSSVTASAIPETIGVFTSFLLYLFWDFISFKIESRLPATDPVVTKNRLRRRRVTRACFAALLPIVAVVLVFQPRTTTAILLIDALLMFLLISYRIAKDWRHAESKNKLNHGSSNKATNKSNKHLRSDRCIRIIAFLLIALKIIKLKRNL